MTLYIAVTSDELELPIAVESSLQILAEKFKVDTSTVLTSIRRNHSGKRRGYKFARVEVEE